MEELANALAWSSHAPSTRSSAAARILSDHVPSHVLPRQSHKGREHTAREVPPRRGQFSRSPDRAAPPMEVRRSSAWVVSPLGRSANACAPGPRGAHPVASGSRIGRCTRVTPTERRSTGTTTRSARSGRKSASEHSRLTTPAAMRSTPLQTGVRQHHRAMRAATASTRVATHIHTSPERRRSAPAPYARSRSIATVLWRAPTRRP